MTDDEIERYAREAPSANERAQRWPEYRPEVHSSRAARAARAAAWITLPTLIVLVGGALGWLAIRGC